LNHQLSIKGFEDNVCCFLKGERSQLKKIFTNTISNLFAMI
jgi:hypothetical protein